MEFTSPSSFQIEVFLARLRRWKLLIVRPNAKSMRCVTVKQHIKCLQPKSMPKMLGQVCHKEPYKNGEGFQEVVLTFILVTDGAQAFVLHVRHATFYIYWAVFPNRYLRDVAEHGLDYRTQVQPPLQHHVDIHQSRPFHMRQPQQQADFFRLFAKLLCYIVSGNSLVPYMHESELNPYYKHVTDLNVSHPHSINRNRRIDAADV